MAEKQTNKITTNLYYTVKMQTALEVKLSNLLAKGLWVLLHLLKDHTHGWVRHNLLHLWISHGPFLHFLRAVIPHGLTYHAALNAF